MTEAIELKIIIPKPKLAISNQKLLELLINKYNNKETVTSKEIVSLYKQYVQRSDTHWAYDHTDGRERYVPYTDNQIERHSRNWLIRSLGTLINKGYLKVIPNMDLVML